MLSYSTSNDPLACLNKLTRISALKVAIYKQINKHQEDLRSLLRAHLEYMDQLETELRDAEEGIVSI